MLNIVRRALGFKASATTRVQVDAVRGADAVWTPREFDKLIEEGYEQAVWVYACVSWLTRLARATTWVVQRGDDEVEEHPLLDLLTRPNEHTTGASFIEQVYGFHLTAGNAYIERVGIESAPPVELWVKRPDRMRVRPDPKALIRGYVYEVAGQKVYFDPWQVRHIKTWHPRNDWYGMSPLEAAARGIDMFNIGMAHNVALMQNGARPTGAWLTSGALSEPQFNRIRDQLHDASRLASRGRPMLIEGGTTWQELGLSPRDLDFLNGQDSAARQIHAAYGVHPVITGLQEGTYENQRQALRSVMVNAVMPFLDTLTAELNEWLVPTYGEDITLAYDKDAFPALSEDQESLWRRADIGWGKGFITRNEARVMVGFDELEGEDGNIFVSDMYLMHDPLAFARAAKRPEPEPEPSAGITKRDEQPVAALSGVLDSDALLPSGRTRGAYWADRQALVGEWTSRVRGHVIALLNAERQDLESAFERAGEDAQVEALVLQTLAEHRERWGSMLPWWFAAMVAGGLDAVDNLARETRSRTAQRVMRKASTADIALLQDAFGLTAPEAAEYARLHTALLVHGIHETTIRAIQAIIIDGVRAGQSVPHIARRIDDLYLDHIIPNRSTVIARTEVMRAINAGAQLAARGTGLNLVKTWMSTADDRTRTPPRDAYDHVTANGQEQPISEPYVVSGEKLMFPADPSGSAGNTIQCRCTEFYRESDNPFQDPDEPYAWRPGDGTTWTPALESIIPDPRGWTPADEASAIAQARQHSAEVVVAAHADRLYRQVDQLTEYTGHSHTDFNGFLRGSPGYSGDDIDSTDEWLYQTAVDDIKRLFEMDSARLPSDMTLWRAASTPFDLIPEDLMKMVGTDLVDAAFLSVTARESEIVGRVSSSSRDRGREPTIIEIRGRQGQNALSLADFSHHPREEEVLYPPDTVLRIVEARRVGKGEHPDIYTDHLHLVVEVMQ